jgi:acetaldehyde dehydrogenase (acetylating)
MHDDTTMTFTVTAYGKTVTITQPEDLDIHQFLDTCRTLAIAMEYHDESWDDAIIEAADAIWTEDMQEQISRYRAQQEDKYENAVTIDLGGDVTSATNKSNHALWVHGDGTVHPYPGIDGIPLRTCDC